MPSPCEPLSLRQFAWNLPNRLDLVVSSRDLLVSASQALGFQTQTIASGFLIWILGFYSGSHACKANTLPIKPSPQPWTLPSGCRVFCVCSVWSCEQVPGVSFLGGLPFVLVESVPPVKWPLRQDSSQTSGSHCLRSLLWQDHELADSVPEVPPMAVEPI